ncbi:MAG: hypothetical protein AB1349_06055 [Elusimicrobiota bacterium]
MEKIKVVDFAPHKNFDIKTFKGTPEEVLKNIHKHWEVKEELKKWCELLIKTHCFSDSIPIGKYFKNLNDDDPLKVIGILGYALGNGNQWIEIEWIKWNDGKTTYIEKEFKKWVYSPVLS